MGMNVCVHHVVTTLGREVLLVSNQVKPHLPPL